MIFVEWEGRERRALRCGAWLGLGHHPSKKGRLLWLLLLLLRKDKNCMAMRGVKTVQ